MNYLKSLSIAAAAMLASCGSNVEPEYGATDLNTTLYIQSAAKTVVASGISVYSKEQTNETNISKPVIYAENNTGQSINDLVMYYYFSTEGSKLPVLEDFYSPEASLSLVSLSENQYAVKIDYSGYNIAPGSRTPLYGDGLQFGLRYGDWSAWDEGNDWSISSSNDFDFNTNIVVESSAGNAGEVPSDSSDSNGSTPPSGLFVNVMSLDEGLHESNIVKPRIQLENTSDQAISDFQVHYYFTTENGNFPVVEDYYTPFSTLAIENVSGDQYRLIYDFTGYTLEANSYTPWPHASSVVGIHYSDWSDFDGSDDYSQPVSNVLTQTSTIVVVDNNGKVIGGVDPIAGALPPKVVIESPVDGANVYFNRASHIDIAVIWSVDGIQSSTQSVATIVPGTNVITRTYTNEFGKTGTDQVTVVGIP